MSVDLKVPPVGESITEVQIGEWLKNEGDFAQRDEIVVKIETDKVTVELPAPVSGVIRQIKVKQGQQATVGQVIGTMEEGEGVSPPPPSSSAAAAAGTSVSSGMSASATPNVEPTAPRPPTTIPEELPPRSVRESIPAQGFARVMPSARRALLEKGLEADDVTATGPGGRLLKEDVMRHGG